MIVPPTASGFTVKVVVAAVPQPVEYVTVAEPGVSPVTPPLTGSIVSIPEPPADQVPPETVLESVTTAPVHIPVGPEIDGLGAVSTVTTCVAIDVPHTLVTV